MMCIWSFIKIAELRFVSMFFITFFVNMHVKERTVYGVISKRNERTHVGQTLIKILI